MLTGRKFEIILLGFPCLSGTTRAVFTKSGKMLCSALELINLFKSGVKKSTATFISFRGMVSIPVAFLDSNLYISLRAFLFQFHLQNQNEIFPLHEIIMGRYFLFAIY